MRVFLLVFLLFPVLELYVFTKVQALLGFFPALLLIIAGVVLGSLVLRIAGLTVALGVRARLARGEMPEREMLEGMLLALGGGLLFLPGFISDVLALFCLLPFVRRALVSVELRRAEQKAVRQRAFADDLQARSGASQPNVIEGEFEHRDS
ncbi:MAG: membrane protein FxsA [Pseudomonadaceae bacterium]|nr:membrane protein FxsA [Pseudomonadaceae bacterium]